MDSAYPRPFPAPFPAHGHREYARAILRLRQIKFWSPVVRMIMVYKPSPLTQQSYTTFAPNGSFFNRASARFVLFEFCLSST